MPTGLGDEQLWLCPSLDNATPFNDLSDQGNNGTANGGLSTVADTGSGGAYCYDLDGSNDYIDVTSSGVPASAYTVSLWQYSTSSAVTTAFNAGEASGARTVNIDGIRAGLSGDNHGHKRGSISYWANNPTVRTSATWYHYLLTYDGSELRLYVDGVYTALKTGVQDTNYTEARCWVGQYAGGGSFFQGRMDDIRTYDRPLTQSEITHLATARGIEGRPFDGLGGEQLWLCPSLENSPNDLSGNNNNGVYQGGAGTIPDVAEGGTRSYEFTNSSHYITGTTDLDTTDDFSLSYWYRSNTGNSFGTNYHIFRARNGTRGFNFYKRYSSGTQTYTGTTICRGGASSNSNTPVDYGIATADWLDWHCFTMNWDNASSTMEYFIDGVSVGTWNASVSGSVDATGTTMILGALGNGTGTANGYIDDLRKYSRKLTQSEISWLATERGVLGTPPEGLGDEQLWLCPSIQDSANDLSGNGNDGAYFGGMGTVVSDGKLCYDFDGTNDYIKVDNSIEFGAVSVSCWVYSDNIASRYRVFDSFDLSRSSGAPDIAIQNENGQGMRVFSQISATTLTPYTPILQSQWYHICSVSDGTNLSLYIDGSLAASVACTTTPQSDQAWIGARGGGNLERLDGQMDDIRAYTRALTQAEITHLASQRGVLGSPATTTQYNAFLTHAFRQLFQTRLR